MATKSGVVKVRKMVEADLAKVNAVDVMLDGQERMLTWPFPFESYWRIYRPELSFVAELEGTVVGFVVGNIVQDEHSYSLFSLRRVTEAASRHRWIGWIDMIGVSPRYQHRGVGRALVEAFYTECKGHNATMRAIANDNDEKLKNFLTNMGCIKSDIVIYEKD